MSVQTKATIASFGGKILKLTHNASTTNCEMGFNLYLPPQATLNPLHKVPVLIYLSGLTCTGDNCAEKGFFQHGASQKGIAVLYPDTSPRTSQSNLSPIHYNSSHHNDGSNYAYRLRFVKITGGLKIAGEDDSYDFGSGAGFYVDATREPWSKGYKMYSYITEELPKALFSTFQQLDEKRWGADSGGEHCTEEVDGQFLKNPGKYKSCSAFAPIANPINCPWGQKAFKGYFGEDQQQKWKEHDATELVKKWKGPLDLLIDVGTGDNFYKEGQLLPENFAKAAKESGNDKELNIRYQPDYDHSYYTMASFADDHVYHAAKHLFA
ncbi:MAG: hypothetical protein M1830_000521 [Pleopsidium flavum]|nr:MAG: hypothetical protein M1830_000521 [Pleopsidium flavum]